MSGSGNAEPTHYDIDQSIQPARRADIEYLDQNANECQRPDNAKHAPLPEAFKGIDTEWSIGSGDQYKDGRVVDLAKDLKGFVFDAHHVIGGAGRKQKDQADAIDGKRNDLGRGAPADNEQGY